jgi:hypothetical protein
MPLGFYRIPVKPNYSGRIMRRKRSEGESVPMTLGQALAAKVRLIVWCKACQHRAEPDVVDQGRALWRRYDRHRLGEPPALLCLRRAPGRFRRQRRGQVVELAWPKVADRSSRGSRFYLPGGCYVVAGLLRAVEPFP